MDLDDWRSRINDLDEQILHLLNQRGQAALQIGELKTPSGARSSPPRWLSRTRSPSATWARREPLPTWRPCAASAPRRS